MNKKNNDLKDALDEIFGDDFIEIDTSDKNLDNNSLLNQAVFTDFELEEEKQDEYEDKNLKSPEIVVNSNEGEIKPYLDDENSTKDLVNEYDQDKVSAQSKLKTRITSFKSINYKYVIATIIIMIIILLSSMIVFIGIIGINKTVTCELAAADTGYSFSDKYEIKYAKNKIKKIKSEYIYKATSTEFKEQVKYVKESKMPVVINSNGINGFTYVVEENENLFKVEGYLDFDIIDKKALDEQDFDLFPLTYQKITSKTTYEDFTNKLKKQGFACKYN